MNNKTQQLSWKCLTYELICNFFLLENKSKCVQILRLKI